MSVAIHEISNKIKIDPANGHCPWNLLFVQIGSILLSETLNLLSNVVPAEIVDLLIFFISCAGFTNYSAHFRQENIARPHGTKCFQSVQILSFWTKIIWGPISVLQFNLKWFCTPIRPPLTLWKDKKLPAMKYFP